MASRNPGAEAAPEPGTDQDTRAPRHRGRKTVGVVAIVLACLLTAGAGLSIWTYNLVLNTDRYVSTVGPLAAKPEVQRALATTISAQLVQQVDVAGRTRAALPEKAAFLAQPLAQTVQELVRRTALRLLETKAFQALWERANRAAHDRMRAALTGEGKLAAAKDGKVKVDLAAVEVKVKKELHSRGVTIFDNVPAVNTSYELLDLAQLRRAQTAVKNLRTLRIALVVAALVFFGVAIAVWPGRWRGLGWSAVGLALTGLILQLAIIAGRHRLANEAPTAEKGDAVTATINQLSGRLASGRVWRSSSACSWPRPRSHGTVMARRPNLSERADRAVGATRGRR